MSDTIIVGAISALVVEMLANGEQKQFTVPTTPLTEGRILLGRQYEPWRGSPSQVVFVPMNSTFGPVTNRSNWVTGRTAIGQAVTPGFQSHLLARPLGTDSAEYLVYCWGQSIENDKEKDFDATRWLAHVVMRACARLTQTSVRFFKGEGWIDQRHGEASLLSAGHVFSFGVAIDIPIIDSADQFPPTPLTTKNILEIE